MVGATMIMSKLRVPFREYDEQFFMSKPRRGVSMITSKKYDTHVSDSLQSLEKYLNIQQGDTLLDIGSGYGDIARELSEKYNSKMYCCDVNAYLLAQAKQNCHKNPNMSFNLVEDDVHPLSFLEDNTIDKAYAYAVFIHNETTAIVNYLKDIIRVLKPGGLFRFNYCNRRLTKQVAPNIIEADRIEIDSVISKLGFTFLENRTTISSLKGQLHAQNLWQAALTVTLIQK